MAVAELEDHASGMKDRLGIFEAVNLARAGTIEGVLADNHDRLCRGRDVRGWLKTELRRFGARVHYASVPDEPDTPEDGVRDDLMSTFAEYDRHKTVGRLNGGRIARVTRNGEILHNGTPPYGYKFNADRTGYVENEDESEWVVAVFERYADGWSPNMIAAWLNEEPGAMRPRRAEQWSRSPIADMLKRDDYTGIGTRLGREIPTDEHGRPLTKRAKKVPENAVEMAFPKLIEPELWRRVEAMREEAAHHTSYGKTDPDAALFKGTGRVICTGCQRPMAYESQEHLTDRKVKGLYRCRHARCTSRAAYRRAEIDEMARCTIRDMVMDDLWLRARYEASMEDGGEIDREIDKATATIKKLARKRKQLQGRVADAVGNDLLYEPLAEQLQEVQAQWLAAKEREADLLRQRARAAQDAERLRDYGQWLADHRAGFDQLDVPGLRWLATLIDIRVRVARGPRGNTAQVTGAFVFNDIDGGEPNIDELERVAFDASSMNRNTRHARKAGTCVNAPSDRRFAGIPGARRFGLRHRASGRDAHTTW